MTNRSITHTIIVTLFVSALIVAFIYGPNQRKNTSIRQSASVATAGELEQLWHANGVHGRIAVLFTRHMKPQQDGSFPEIDYLDTALQEGVVRKAYIIIPDAVWVKSMVEILQDESVIIVPRKTDSDAILLHRGGRIHIMPFTRFIPPTETSLVVYEPTFWSEQERLRVEGMLATRQLDADLVAVIR